MTRIATTAVNCILTLLLCMVVLTFYGVQQYSCDMDNIKAATNKYVDTICDQGECTDYMTAQFYNTVAADTLGTYDIVVKHYIQTSNPIPGTSIENPETYITEYQGEMTDKFNTGDRIQAEIYCTEFPLFMSISSTFIGRVNPGKCLYRISDKVR